MIDVDTGNYYSSEELEVWYSNHTTEEIKERERTLVEVKGTQEAVSRLAANLASSEANLRRVQEEARQRVYRRMK